MCARFPLSPGNPCTSSSLLISIIIPMAYLLQAAFFLLLALRAHSECSPCYKPSHDSNCPLQDNEIPVRVQHMSVHPHLDAFWIFDFESYYEPLPTEFQVHGYFQRNRFSSVRQIFDSAYDVLSRSKALRDSGANTTQKAHRSFFNSEMGFFKRWFSEQDQAVKTQVKNLLKTKYWEIVGGGYVEHDEGCAYYQDIIENYEMGLHFLKGELDYTPKVAISADSFGHSQSTLAILAHIGIEGFLVERSDEHILLENKTEFIWRARSTNGQVYGALPTHIRWAIHGFEDQFLVHQEAPMCRAKEQYIDNMQQENEFLKRILRSSHILRYFGHDFQKFDNYSYSVIETIMEEFSIHSCNRVVALYGNPSEYFQILMQEVFNSVKDVQYRNQDIFPIWDYDSGLYWTGYFTTDPFHKKQYRDCGRFLSLARKAFLPRFIQGTAAGEKATQGYDLLQQLAEVVAYLQHHDGISGTSRYEVMDKYEKKAQSLVKRVEESVIGPMFQTQFPLGSSNPVLTCGIFADCVIPSLHSSGDLYVKLFNSGTKVEKQRFILRVPEGVSYQAEGVESETICLCYAQPCSCSVHVISPVLTFTPVRLRKVKSMDSAHYLRELPPNHQMFRHNSSHLFIQSDKGNLSLTYKKVIAQPTRRNYKHLSRYGQQRDRDFTINSGKYALGNNPNTEQLLARIRKVSIVESTQLAQVIIQWNRDEMKTVISFDKRIKEQWKVETYSNAGGSSLQDLYLEVSSNIKNGDKFYTDSNGWLTMERQLFHHEDYKAHFSPEGYDDINGNTYPMTAFAYIKDDKSKMSINTDRPQGVISPRPGILWVNYDRITSDDGKWVDETTHRNEYQRFTHHITLGESTHNQERVLQDYYDHPLVAQISEVESSERIEDYSVNLDPWREWATLSGSQSTKFWVRPWNDSSVTLRIQNNNDENSTRVGLFAGKVSPYLTTFFGNVMEFDSIEEMSLGGNMKYEQFLQGKWNWNSNINLTQENQIFNKEFAENITLRPLQIRTFSIKGLRLKQECHGTDKLLYNNHKKAYRIDQHKAPPLRKPEDIKNEEDIKEFLLKGDHCSDDNPVLHTKTVSVPDSVHNWNPPHPKGKSSRPSDPVDRPESNKQVLPQDISSKTFYSKLKILEDKPAVITEQAKKQNPPQQSKDTTKSQGDANLPENDNSIAIEETRELPNVDDIRKKIMLWNEISREEKRQYFAQKLLIVASEK